MGETKGRKEEGNGPAKGRDDLVSEGKGRWGRGGFVAMRIWETKPSAMLTEKSMRDMELERDHMNPWLERIGQWEEKGVWGGWDWEAEQNKNWMEGEENGVGREGSRDENEVGMRREGDENGVGMKGEGEENGVAIKGEWE